MSTTLRRLSTLTAGLAGAASLLFAAATAQANDLVTAGQVIRAIPRGIVDIRTLPEPRQREDIRIIRKPLPFKFKNNPPPAPTVVDRPSSEQAPLVSANLVRSFEGIGASGLEPPDPHIAVGPQDVLLATNAGLRVYSKTGSPITGIIDPSDFFAVPSAFEIQSDPKVLYDKESGRFFAVWIGFDQQGNVGAWFVAASTSSSAAGTFVRYQINEAGNLPDYPSLGVCSNKVVITANDFRPSGGSFAFTGAVAIALEKADLVSGASSLSLNRFGNVQQSGGGQIFTLQAAQALTPTNTCYMVALRSNNSSIQVYRITGTPPSASLTTVSTTPSLEAAVSLPTDGRQPSSCGSARIDSGDTRLLDATYRGVNGGSIWTSGNTGCTSNGASGFTCANVVELSNVDSTPSRRQQTIYGFSNGYALFPALRTDSRNNMTLIFSRVSSSEFNSLRYATRLNSQPVDVFESSNALTTPGSCYTGTRWGDYQGAALDPSDDSSIWIYGEVKRSTANFWQTFAGQTLVP